MRGAVDIEGDGRLVLYRGDCLKIIPKLGPVTHTITDPPYEAEMHRAKGASRQDARGNPRGHKAHAQSGRKLRTDGRDNPKPVTFSSIDGLRERVTPLIKARTARWFIAFCTPEGIAPWRDAIEDAGMRYKRACFWMKPDGAPQFNGQGPAFAVEPFVTAWGGRGVSRWNGGGQRNYYEIPTNGPDREGTHETEKPLALMLRLILLFTSTGDLVLDPFMGSGTTGLACALTGRKFIGIEKDPTFFKLACARIETAPMGPHEARRHITRAMGRKEAPGPLFGGSLAI